MDEERYRAAIRKGMALLDTHRPDWRTRLEGVNLNMDHCKQCVLGHVLGGYAQHLVESLLGGPVPAWAFDHWAADYGFTLTNDDLRGYREEIVPRFARLTRLWEEELHHGP